MLYIWYWPWTQIDIWYINGWYFSSNYSALSYSVQKRLIFYNSQLNWVHLAVVCCIQCPLLRTYLCINLQNRYLYGGCRTSNVREGQALKSICPIQFLSWVNYPLPILAIWGNKKWLPSMKVKKMGKFQNKRGLIGCKCSSLNVPGIRIHVYHPILELGELHSSHY